jgi:hypothetical protein
VWEGRIVSESTLGNRLLKFDPKYSISGFFRQRAPMFQSVDQSRWQFILDALRAAGVPE